MVAGVEATPKDAAGAERLKLYWTKNPEGLAKWASDPHPWTALYHHLVKFVNPDFAKRLTETYYRDVFGMPSGWRRGQDPVGPG